MTTDADTMFLLAALLFLRALPPAAAGWGAAFMLVAGLIQKYAVNA